MNGVLVLSAHSGMLVYHRAFKPRFGFGALGSNELQLSSMLFAVYQCALSVDIADPDDGESSGLKRFRKAGIEVTFTVMSDKDLLLVSVVDACMSRNSRDLLVEQLRTFVAGCSDITGRSMKPSVVKVVGQRLHAAYSTMVGQAAGRLQASEYFASYRRLLVLAFTRTRSVLATSPECTGREDALGPSGLGTRRDECSTAHMNDSNLSVLAPSCMESLVHGMRFCWSGGLFSLCRMVKSNSVAPLPDMELESRQAGMEANCNRPVEASGGLHRAANKILLLIGSNNYYTCLKRGGGCMDSLIDLVGTSVCASAMDSIPRMGDPLRQLVLTLDKSVMARCRSYSPSDVVESSLEIRRPTPVTASDREDKSSGRRSSESEKKKNGDLSVTAMGVGCCRVCEESSEHWRCLEVIQLRDVFLVVASETDDAPSPFEGCSCSLLRDLLLLIDSYLVSFGEERLQLHMEITNNTSIEIA